MERDVFTDRKNFLVILITFERPKLRSGVRARQFAATLGAAAASGIPNTRGFAFVLGHLRKMSM